MLGIRRYKGIALDLFQGDITEFTCDAIVNAANSRLAGGGGVDGAIHRAGGPEIMEQCRKFDGCPTGQAVITTAGKLPAQHVVHTVGPVWKEGDKEAPALLQSAYYNSLQCAVEVSAAHVAFPAISTGVYNYPVEDAAEQAFQAVKRFIDTFPESSLKRITMVLFSGDDYLAFQKKLFGFFPDEP